MNRLLPLIFLALLIGLFMDLHRLSWAQEIPEDQRKQTGVGPQLIISQRNNFYNRGDGDCLTSGALGYCSSCMTIQLCADECDNTPNCAGFSFNQISPICITRSSVCTQYTPNGLNYFYAREVGGSAAVCTETTCSNGGVCQVIANEITCFCPTGFIGPRCQQIGVVNPCESVPCLNGGSCVARTDQTFECSCPTGFGGARCETNFEPCSSQPCQNGGFCRVRESSLSFDCECTSGFTGIYCTEPVPVTSPCTPNPCRNNGYCFQTGGGQFQCTCQPGFTGLTCESIAANPCSENVCNNGGICSPVGTSFTCTCFAGFTGSTCDQRLTDPCTPNPCLNQGQCTPLGSNDYRCICPPGCAGPRCGQCTSVNACDRQPCQNGGTCRANPAAPESYQCFCNSQFTGINCETIVTPDFCLIYQPCRNGGTCSSTSAPPLFWQCTCPPGYSGLNCQEEEQQRDPCSPNPCLNQGQCIADGGGSYSCSCPPPYTGQNCADRPAPLACTSLPCLNGGSCSEVSFPPYYRCNCLSSFTGQSCEQGVAPPSVCSTSNPCRNGGQCYDYQISPFYQCACPSSFTGRDCEQAVAPPSICATNNPCRNGGQCYDLPSSPFYQCSCLSSFTGRDCEQAVASSVCATNNPCRNGGQCYDLSSSPFYQCSCPSSFTGQDCQTPTGPTSYCQGQPCRNGGTCYEQPNAPPYYQCVCPALYTGRDCETYQSTPAPRGCNSFPCLNGGSCENTANFPYYQCRCSFGYEGPTCATTSTGPLGCTVNPCRNNGRCAVTNQPPFFYQCFCTPRYTGVTCDSLIQLSACASNPCRNGGRCADFGDSFTCQCEPGWTGVFCATPVGGVSKCQPNPCLNNGICTEAPGTSLGFNCQCQGDFEGPRCITKKPRKLPWPNYPEFTKYSGICFDKPYNEWLTSPSISSCYNLCNGESSYCQAFSYNQLTQTCKLFDHQCYRISIIEEGAKPKSADASNGGAGGPGDESINSGVSAAGVGAVPDEFETKVAANDPDEAYYQRTGMCSYSTPGSEFVAEWIYDNSADTVTFTVTSRVTNNAGRSWVGIGFTPDEKMLKVDYVLGLKASNGKEYVTDRYINRDKAIAVDGLLGGGDNLRYTGWTERNGQASLSFTRPRISDNQFDVSLSKDPNTEDGTYFLVAINGGPWTAIGSSNYSVGPPYNEPLLLGPFWMQPCQGVNRCSLSDACSNGGSCIASSTGFRCACPELFTGTRCESRITDIPEPSIASPERVLQTSFCFGAQADIRCPADRRIRVYDAHFGRINTLANMRKCMKPGSSQGGAGNCGYHDVSKLVMEKCEDEVSCQFDVTSRTLSNVMKEVNCDTCSGYLDVAFACEEKTSTCGYRGSQVEFGASWSATNYASSKYDDDCSRLIRDVEPKCDKGCAEPVSDQLDEICAPRWADFRSPGSHSWCASQCSVQLKQQPMLILDLGAPYKVTGFLLQGRRFVNQYISEFSVSRGPTPDGAKWVDVLNSQGKPNKFVGNSDASGIFRYVLPPSSQFVARYIRLHVLKFKGAPAGHFDVIRCDKVEGCAPVTVEHSDTVNKAAGRGINLQVKCKPTWALRDGSTEFTIYCQQNGQWSNLKECDSYVRCGSVPAVNNALQNATSTYPGALVTYTCDQGYRLQGNPTVECLSSGKWTTAPVCTFNQ